MLKTSVFRKTGEVIPKLGMGMMRLPTTEAGEIDRAAATALVDRAYEAGIRYFDTALGYHNGKSAAFMGEVLEKYPRESLKYANKLPMWAVKEKDDIEKIFNKQLEDLRTDYIDFYLLHAMNSENWKRAKELGAIDFLVEQKKAGRIRALGFSFHGTAGCLSDMLTSYSWDFVQLQLNYLDWYAGSARREYEFCRVHGLQIMIMEPIRGGALASQNLPEKAAALFPSEGSGDAGAAFALRFAANLPNALVVLSGMTTEEQLRENCETFSEKLIFTDVDEKRALEAISAIKDGHVVFCTACEYCMETCPIGVQIPKIFTQFNKKGSLDEALIDSAKSCIACGECVERCTQGLEIPTLLSGIVSGKL